MGSHFCDIHKLRYQDDGKCPICIDRNIPPYNSRTHRNLITKQDIKRPWANEESVCECCGQRFIDQMRVYQTVDDLWTGILSRYVTVGVCPSCFDRYDQY